MLLSLAAGQAVAAPITFTAAGGSAAAIQATVDSFRAALGTLNPNTAGSFGTGRREINWDGVPNSSAAPNAHAGNFFNTNSPRGVVLSTPGSGFQVSATAASGIPVDFGNINPSYPALFNAFSAERLFTAIGSNITDVSFFVPGTTTPALSRGFGAVFADVDIANITGITLFDIDNASLGTFFAPATNGNGTFSFVGALFNEPLIAHVRITSGTGALGGNDVGQGVDLVVMDDFIFGEPVAALAAAVPAPGFAPVLLAGALLPVLRRRRRPD